MSVFSELERYGAYSALQLIQNSRTALEELDILGDRKHTRDLVSFFLFLYEGGEMPMYITLLPLDRNIAGKRVTEFLQTERLASGTLAWDVNSVVARNHFETMERLSLEKSWQVRSPWRLLRVPLIRTRSELIADYMISLFYPAFRSAQFSLDRTNTHLDLLRVSIALERYHAANGEYPAALDALVPTYLEEVPLEPLTGRKSFVYKPSPDADTAFLLHSSEWREDDGRTKELFVRMKR